MKLVRARVQNYRSIEDSGEFEIGDLTCLVGKNEAGKTTLLNALRGLRPLQPFAYDETYDYPRRFAQRFDERHPEGRAEIVRTWWKLSEADRHAVADRFGHHTLKSDVVQISTGFRFDQVAWDIEVDEAKCLDYLIDLHKLDETEKNVLHGATDGPTADAALSAIASRSTNQNALLESIKACRSSRFTLGVIDVLSARTPKFFYTSHFERMSGEISIEQLQTDKGAGKVIPGDQIFLDFLEYAGTSLEELKGSTKREALKAKCEAAGNDITEEIFQFWSQNNALEVVIDFEAGKSGDRPPFNTGTVAQIRIRNVNHKATLPLSERSAGFVWFFSFLAQFKQLKKQTGNAIILLDEPGLTLHGRAQGDLLKYIIERLLPEHQVIFTTHSPFMVPADRLVDVRIVEDVIEHDGRRQIVKGTKVRTDVLKVDDDTLFPLQGALGYEITQTLFIGTSTLLVEGPSDIVYLHALSQALRRRGRESLRSEWTLCPSGGIGKILPFLRLFSGKKLNFAVLSDIAKGDFGKVEEIRRSDILKAGHFYTAADFVDQNEADIEDFFGSPLFAALLNHAYDLSGSHAITADRLMQADTNTSRIVKKAEALFNVMSDIPEFSHYAPAEWLMRNPSFLDADTVHISETLGRAEKLFNIYNSLLPSRR